MRRSPPTRAVHPRVCGADSTIFPGQNIAFGSPPRVRGRPRLRAPAPGARRFTPACAGQTSPPRRGPNRTTVHPRVCGADDLAILIIYAGHGSPPRVRGRLALPPLSLAHPRFTPACAGQTRRCPRSSRAHAVHPRVCGADTLPAAPTPLLPGSPPRVRGRHHTDLLIGQFDRFTPACAGQTTILP